MRCRLGKGKPGAGLCACSATRCKKLHMLDIFITIDTECSLGGALDDPSKLPVQPERAILGRIGSDCYGTPLLMSILERNGLRGTFFLEVLASHVTDAQQMADAYGQIIARGHDAQ